MVTSEGDDAALACYADGHPRPTVRWLREDKGKFPAHDPKLNHSRRNMGTLLIRCRGLNKRYSFSPFELRVYRQGK